MNPVLLRPCRESATSVEFTPEGHEFTLSNDYDHVIARLQAEAEILVGAGPLKLECTSCPVPEVESGAGMPPVVSFLRQSDPENGRPSDRFLLHLLPEQECFRGHFPDQAILPGIIQLHWAVRLAHSCLGRPAEPREVVQLKYRNIAVPPRFIELQLETGNGPDLSFRMHSRDGVHAQGKLVYSGSS